MDASTARTPGDAATIPLLSQQLNGLCRLAVVNLQLITTAGTASIRTKASTVQSATLINKNVKKAHRKRCVWNHFNQVKVPQMNAAHPRENLTLAYNRSKWE